jgi:CHAD domain-containing protein
MPKAATTATRTAAVLHAQVSLGLVLIESLKQRWSKYLKELRRAKKAPSEEAVHDLRVATRRLISTLRICELLIPDARIERLRRRLKRLFDACSPLRDTQVQLLALEPQLAAYPELDTLMTILRVREQDLIRSIARKAAKADTTRWRRTIRWIEGTLREQFSQPLMHEAATTIVLGAAAQAFATALFFSERVVATKPETIHKARIAFKKFRYTLEALAPLLPHLDRDLLKAMDAYQTRMGVIQDAEVLEGVVKRFAERQPPAARRKLTSYQTQLRRQKQDLIAAYMQGREEVYSFWKPAELIPIQQRDGTSQRS